VRGPRPVNHRRPLIFHRLGSTSSFQMSKETDMGEKKKKKTKVEATTIAPETHWLRSTMIVLLVVALTLGVWYFVNERD